MFTQRSRPPRTIDFTCDECSSEFLETQDYTLREAMPAFRAAGWHLVQIEGDWEHYCPGCSRKLEID